jgi:hypothetical protein
MATLLAPLLKRRGLALAPLQDPRVAALLGLPPHKLLQTIRFVNSDSLPYAGADALIRVAEEFWWPVRWPERQKFLA